MPTQTEIVAAHTVDIQRFATDLLRARIFPTLKQARIAAQRILLDYDEITGVTQLNAISAALRKELNPILNDGWEGVTGELNELAPIEAAFMAGAIATANDLPPLRVPNDEQIQRFINRSLMSLTSGNRVTAGTWAELVNKNILSNIGTFDNQVKAGFNNGETTNQIARRLRTVEEGLLRNESEALARTGVQHYAVQAREAMAQQNKSVIASKWYDITFDSRTTTICISNNSSARGNPYALDDKSAPSIPAHYNCRSAWLYLVNGQTEPEGMRPVVGGKPGEAAKEKFEKRQDRTDKKVRYRGRRDSEIFDVRQARAKTKYESFFLAQPAWWQNSTLGVAKAKAVRDGFPIENLTDMFSNPLTVAQLRAMYPKYFG